MIHIPLETVWISNPRNSILIAQAGFSKCIESISVRVTDVLIVKILNFDDFNNLIPIEGILEKHMIVMDYWTYKYYLMENEYTKKASLCLKICWKEKIILYDNMLVKKSMLLKEKMIIHIIEDFHPYFVLRSYVELKEIIVHFQKK